MVQKPGIQGKHFWKQPALERIINDVKSVSPILENADDFLVFRLIVTRTHRNTQLFGRLMDYLGSRADWNKITGVISEANSNYPLMGGYFKHYNGYTREEGQDVDIWGVPTLETYSNLMNSLDDRTKFGRVKPEDPPYI